MRKALAVALVFCGFFGTSPRAIARAFEVSASAIPAVLAQAHGAQHTAGH